MKLILCVRWYVAYPLSMRHLEEMMAEHVKVRGQWKYLYRAVAFVPAKGGQGR